MKYGMLIQALLTAIIVLIVYMQLARKSWGITVAYSLQSLAVIFVMLINNLHNGSKLVYLILLIMFIGKVVLIPRYVIMLVNRYKLTFAVATYLNSPLTVIVIALLIAFSHSQQLQILNSLIPNNKAYLSLALAAILLSMFLIINRKGAISKVIGLLSMENSVMIFALFAGLEQSVGLQIGIVFVLFVWFFIALMFLTMLQKRMGTLDTAQMRMLKE